MSNPFPEKIVHIDMKGAPLRPEAYERFFPLVKELGAFGLLMEYEDMFPYTGVLESIRRKNAYSDADIRRIVEMADLNGLEVIPLVQTFGHLEFVLKQPMFQKLSENATETNTICISNDNSFEIIRQMLKQIRSLHPESRRIHIGADEAYHVAEEEKCLQRLHSNFHGDTEEMGVAHIARVSKLAHEFGFETVFAWNDMFQHAHPHLLMKYGLDSLIVPVVWGYRESVTEPGYFPLGLFERLSLVFESVYFATAFKGAIDASNQFVSVRRYLHTHYSYVELLRNDAKPVSGIMGGVFITGWSRYAHNLPLCELLPSSLPSLLADLIYLQDVNQIIEEVERKLQGRLNCSVKLLENFSAPKDFAGLQYIMPIESAYAQCDFLWTDVFRLVEDLRFLTWRSKNAWQIGEQLRAKLRKEVEYLTNEANSTLSKLFFDDTVEEFVIQNIQSLFKIIDEPPENELSF